MRAECPGRQVKTVLGEGLPTNVATGGSSEPLTAVEGTGQAEEGTLGRQSTSEGSGQSCNYEQLT